MSDDLFVVGTWSHLLTVPKASNDTIMKRYHFALLGIIVDDRTKWLVTDLLNTIEMLMSITRRSLDTYAGWVTRCISPRAVLLVIMIPMTNLNVELASTAVFTVKSFLMALLIHTNRIPLFYEISFVIKQLLSQITLSLSLSVFLVILLNIFKQRTTPIFTYRFYIIWSAALGRKDCSNFPTRNQTHFKKSISSNS